MTDQIEKAQKLLSEAGFTLSVGGCGCCESPWVRLTHNGTDIIFEEFQGKIVDRINTKIQMHETD